MDSKDVVNNFISSQIFTNHQGLTQAENVDKSLKKVVDNLYAGKQETDAQLATIGSDVSDLTKSLKTENETNTFYVTDGNGNVITKTNAQGFFATAIKILKNGNLVDLLELLANVGVQGISSEFSDSLYITDSNGYVFFSITKNASGQYELNYVGKDQGGISNTWLTGKNIFVLGDSLSTSGQWMQKVAELTGANFDKSVNFTSAGAVNNLSEGGTATIPAGESNGQGRARRLVKYAQEHPNVSVDVIFVQNINDVNRINGKGSITDAPYFISQEITLAKCSAEGASNALSYFQSNISTLLANVTPKKGSVVRLPYVADGSGIPSKVLKITKKATTNGDITLTVGGRVYNVAVTTSMSIAQIQGKILEWDFADVGMIDEDGGDGASVIFTKDDGSTPSVTANTNSTGVTLSITASTVNTAYLTMYYKDKTTSNFLVASSWTNAWYNAMSIYGGYKGLIEYLQDQFPKSVIVMCLSPRISVNFASTEITDIKYADGSYNISAWLNASYQSTYIELMDLQKNVANLYGLPIVDVWSDSGITLFNAYPTYYGNSNVHPTAKGYERWGETVSRLLTGK